MGSEDLPVTGLLAQAIPAVRVPPVPPEALAMSTACKRLSSWGGVTWRQLLEFGFARLTLAGAHPADQTDMLGSRDAASYADTDRDVRRVP